MRSSKSKFKKEGVAIKHLEPIKFVPVYKDYLWGGNKLSDKYKKGDGTSFIAESWEICAHKNGMSIISGGEFDGFTLSEYIQKNKAVLGTQCKTDFFPILIKFIDAHENLSVQVHPNDETAQKFEAENGKTELWYVIEAEPYAKITYGFNKSVTKAELEAAIRENRLESLLKVVKSTKGDSYFIPAGTVHAIGKGNLILEIQQNSNLTYRLYDYGRVDKNGSPRELHIKKGIEATELSAISAKNETKYSDGMRLLGCCEYFCVKELLLSGKKVMVADEKSYHAIVITDGTATLKSSEYSTALKQGDSIFVPAGFGEYYLDGNATVIITAN